MGISWREMVHHTPINVILADLQIMNEEAIYAKEEQKKADRQSRMSRANMK